jgi:hypothetical protein
MQKNILVSVIITSLIVAILASVVTLSLTGNIIKINQDARGKYRVYNVSESDNLLKSCQIIHIQESEGITCEAECLLNKGIATNTLSYVRYNLKGNTNDTRLFVMDWLEPTILIRNSELEQLVNGFTNGNGVIEEIGFGCKCCFTTAFSRPVSSTKSVSKTKFPF